MSHRSRRNASSIIGSNLYSRAVLVDTGALFAIANKADRFHQMAVDCLKLISNHRLPVFISLPTIYETQRKILFECGHDRSLEFLRSMFDGSVNVERTEMEDVKSAINIIEKYQDSGLTLTDAANMAVMLRLQIGVIFSFDKHFLQIGFIRVPPFHLV